MNRKVTKTFGKIAKKRGVSATHVQHVLPLGNGWVVKNSSTGKFTVITDTKQEAVTIARNMAKSSRAELIIHSRDGRILERTSYAI